MDALEKALDTVKLTPTQRNNLEKAADDIKLSMRQRIRRRTESIRMRSFEPIPLTVASVLGGPLAEVVRRKLIGRFAVKVTSQGLGLIVFGWGVSAGSRYLGIPFGEGIGAAHSAVGAWVTSLGFWGTKDQPDPVRIAIEGTTQRALNPPPADK